VGDAHERLEAERLRAAVLELVQALARQAEVFGKLALLHVEMLEPRADCGENLLSHCEYGIGGHGSAPAAGMYR